MMCRCHEKCEVSQEFVGMTYVILHCPMLSLGHPTPSLGHPMSSLNHSMSSYIIPGSSYVISRSSYVILHHSWVILCHLSIILCHPTSFLGCPMLSYVVPRSSVFACTSSSPLSTLPVSTEVAGMTSYRWRQ